MTNEDIDPEVLYVIQLHTVLRLMRRDLDDAAIKRVLFFALGNYGIATSSILVTAMSAKKPNIPEVASPPDISTNGAVPEEQEEPARRQIGRELRAMRIAAGLSQRNLADRAGVKQGTISAIELGYSSQPDWLLEKVRAALEGVRTDDLPGDK